MSDAAKNWEPNEEIRFRDLALRYQEIASLAGIKLNPFRSSDMPLFSKATTLERRNACDFLESILSIHEETLAAKEELNSRQLLWRALRKLSLVPKSEIFELIRDDDVVLLYNDSQTLVFWNLQFFNFTSLTVEELFFSHWYNFTKRDPAIHQKLYEVAMNVVSGKISGVFSPDVPGHEVEEVGTLECLKTFMEIPHGCTLSKNGTFEGFLIAQRMRII